MRLHGRRLTLVLATLLAVVIVVGGAAAFAVGRSQRLAADHSRTHVTTASGTPSGGPSTGASAGASATPPASRAPSASPAPSAPSASAASSGPAASSSAPAGSAGSTPTGQVRVALSARAVASPDAVPVSDLLARYFTAINRHDYDAWLTTVSTSQAKRDRDNWTDGYSTTTDEKVYVSDIFRKGTTLLVRIQFVSHQAVDKAPAALPADCIRWDVTYQIVDEGTGLRVGNSADKPSMARCS